MRTATYKGREYRLDYLGATRYGRRAKLTFFNGAKSFWVDAARVREVFARPSAPPAPPPVPAASKPPSDAVPTAHFDHYHEDEFDVRRAELDAERAAYEDEYRAEIEAGGDYRPSF